MELPFLGHVLWKDSVSPDPTKVEAIIGCRPPNSATEVWSFLGLANYYQQFICDFASVAAPLYTLTTKGTIFHWGAEEQNAFSVLKNRLVEVPVLVLPSNDVPFILHTDASGVAIGVVLAQTNKAGQE
jgi:alpha-tubulin suppressor-like RCC1 family protein